MSAARLLTAVLLSLLLVPGAQAAREAAAMPSALAAPQGLQPFLLRPGEAVPDDHAFSRTPSFAWRPVAGAERYEFELSKDPNFTEGSVFWTSNQLKTPAVAVPAALPWTTADPCPQARCAIYAHVRAIGGSKASTWSTAFGFNLRWKTTPTDCTTLSKAVPGCPDHASYPGLVRWSLVDGASSYDVWFTDGDRNGKVIRTSTNVADERDYYTFHQDPFFTGLVHWRVRAVRQLYGSVPNKLPAVTYGPWSPLFTAFNPPFTPGTVQLNAALADVNSSAGSLPKSAGALTPGFVFSGNTTLAGTPTELSRVYIFSDKDCVNMIYRGSIVGSPAFAPRMNGTIDMPTSPGVLQTKRGEFLLSDGKEPTTFMLDTSKIDHPTEQDLPSDNTVPAGTPGAGGSGAGSSTTPTGSGTATTPTDPDSQVPAASDGVPSTPSVTGAPIDLWDSGWPNGHFYWTVVPVRIVIIASAKTTLGVAAAAGASQITVTDASGFAVGAQIGVGLGSQQQAETITAVNGTTFTLSDPLKSAYAAGTAVLNSGSTLEYHDAELPQDVCAQGRVGEFGKKSDPVVATAGSKVPFAAGLSPQGRLLSAASPKPSFYGAPLVAWQPAVGADEYEVQWSPTLSPWNPIEPKTQAKYQKLTYATSAILPLTPGTWYYRVRGLDFSLPGTARAMTWSTPVALKVAKPRFRVVKR